MGGGYHWHIGDRDMIGTLGDTIGTNGEGHDWQFAHGGGCDLHMGGMIGTMAEGT